MNRAVGFLLLLSSLIFPNYITDWVHFQSNPYINNNFFIEFYNDNDIVFIDFDNSNKIIYNRTGFKIKPEKYFKEIYFENNNYKFNQSSSNSLLINYSNNFNQIGTLVNYNINQKINSDYNISFNSINNKINKSVKFNFQILPEIILQTTYSEEYLPYNLLLAFDEFIFNNESSINKKITGFNLSYNKPSYSLQFSINNNDFFTDNSNDNDILYLKTKKNKEIFTKMSFILNQNLITISIQSSKPQFLGNLKSFGTNIYECYYFQGSYEKLNIENKFKNKELGLNFKSTKFDILGRLNASHISDDLDISLGAPNINNSNSIKMDQILIYFNKRYDNHLFDIQFIYEYYDFYFQSSTPPFTPIIPIINSERMDLKKRLAINFGISKNYYLKNILINIFINQQIPIKNYYTTKDGDNLSISDVSQYGGGKIGFNIYFNKIVTSK